MWGQRCSCNGCCTINVPAESSIPAVARWTGVVQCVMVKGQVSEEIFQIFDSLTQESSFSVKGKVRKDDRAPGGYELDLIDIPKIYQIAQEYPITPKDHGIEFLADRRHLWLRSTRQHAIMRVRHRIIKAIRDYFDGNGLHLSILPPYTSCLRRNFYSFSADYFDLGKAYPDTVGAIVC